MRRIIAAAVVLLLGLAPVAAQQFPNTIPDHTVIGRIGTGTGSGPAQAIPFTEFTSQTSGFAIGAPIANGGINGECIYVNNGVVGQQTCAAGSSAAGSLTGTTLASNVTASSLTSFGSAATLNNPIFTGNPSGVGSVITINGTNCTLSGACTISIGNVITSSSANAFAVGLNGATNPAFNVDASTASQAAGLNVKGAATGGTVAVAAIDSGSNTNLTINAKGSGTIGIGNVSTGTVTITPATTIVGALTLDGAAVLSGGLSAPLNLANGGTNAALTASNGGIVYSTGSALAVLAGTGSSSQCLISAASPPGPPIWGSCSGGGASVSGVSNSDGTLTISPTTGAVVASLALGNANTWTAAQTFTNSDLLLKGSSSGATTFTSANASATNYTLTVPAVTSTLAVLGLNQTYTNTQAFTGTITVPTQAQGDASTKAASTAFVQQNQPGGYINKFRDGTLDIWQRGTTALATATAARGAYTADGWRVQQTGAAFTCAQDTGNGGALYSLKCVGGASNTDTLFIQPIESYVAAPLAGQTVTVQFQYKQTSGSSVTPKGSACYASTQDNFSTCTSDLASTSLTACASGTWCTESYTFPVSANAVNGYQVTLDCNTALTAAQACWLTAADVRVTPGVATGTNAAPPPPELRPIWAELAFSQRYFQWLPFSAYFYAALSSLSSASFVSYNTQMRTVPTISGLVVDPNLSQSTSNVSGNFFENVTINGAMTVITAAAAGQAYVFGFRASADAEL